MSISIRIQILIGTMGIVILLGLAMIIFVQTTLSQRLLLELQEEGIFITKHLANMSVNHILNEHIIDLQILVNDHLSFRDDIEYIFVLDWKGQVLVHTFEEGFPIELKEANILNSEQTYNIQSLLTEKGAIFDIAVPMLNGGAGVVHVGISEEPTKNRIANIIKLIVGIIIAVLVLGGIAAVVFATVITKPIVDLGETAKAVSGGDLERRVHVRAKDEVGQLGVTFNKMLEDSQRNYNTQTAISSLLHLSLEDIPLEELLKRALDLILSIPWLAFESKGSIFLVENDPEVLVMKAQSGLEEPIQKACERVPFGRCQCGQAALTQEIQFADCLDNRHEIHYEGITPHGHYCVPILFAGRTLGVINMYLREGHLRDQREEEFLNAIADTLAGIIIRKRTEEANDKLMQQQISQEKELAVASEIQNSLLPKELPRGVGMEISGINIMARGVGGDYYDCVLNPSGQLAFVIADVMGKGIPAALLMSTVRAVWRDNIMLNSKSSDEILSRLNQTIYSDFSSNGRFVTAFSALYNPSTFTLKYSNGGHNPPLYLPYESNQFEELDTDGLLIGIMPDSKYYVAQRVLNEGDLIVIYTDGIVEAERDEELFGIEKLKELIIQNRYCDVKEIQDKIISAVKEYTQGEPQSDDITLMVLRVSGEL